MKAAAAPASVEGHGASGLPEAAGALARRPSTRVVAALWAATVLAAIAEAALTLAALGGALRVRSQPGDGTILSGELPLTPCVRRR